MTEGLDAIFRPRSVAVVGASNRVGSIGREILRNLVDNGFAGPVFPVNRNARVVHSIKAYRTVGEIPDPVDLAIVVVPRDAVCEVVRDCGEAGVGGLVVITAGFKETGDDGARLEERLAETCRRYGMRMIGPNCMGVLNTDPGIRLFGSFAANRPIAGNAAFMSQSGALGEAILAHARRIGVGISMFASLGNKTDVKADDLLTFWGDDPRTDLILMYLESFGSPERFIRFAREISRTKPLVAVKAGRTARGARAAASHTGALAGADLAIDAMMEQCGVLRVASIEELFDVASVLSTQPLPNGRRLTIVTNAGGPAIMATDAAETLGLEIASLSEATRDALAGVLPTECSVANPVDLIAGADAGRYRDALTILGETDDADLYLVIFVSPAMIDAAAVARQIATFRRTCRRPIAACIMGKLGEDAAGAILREAGVPVFLFPENAIRGLFALVRHAEWVRRPAPVYSIFEDVDPVAARAALEPTIEAGGGLVPWEAATRVLEAYGIRFARCRTVADPAAARRAAVEIGLPVVLKVAAVNHKSDIGGVRVGLASAEAVEEAAVELSALSRSHGGEGTLLVQEMKGAEGGKELILGVQTDPQFGHLLMVGAGGIYVEYTRDVVFRVAPIDEAEGRAMLESLRTYPILEGVRGESRSAIEVAVDALLRLDALVAAVPEIEELDLNPFILTPGADGCGAVDVRLRVRGRA